MSLRCSRVGRWLLISWLWLCPVVWANAAAWSPIRFSDLAQPGWAGSSAEAKEVVWLRSFVQVPDNMTVASGVDLWSDSAMVWIGGVTAAHEVFLNGKSIGRGEPGNTYRRFKIPRGVLAKSSWNVLALRFESPGELRLPPLVSGYFDELKFDREWQWQRGEVVPSDLAHQTTAPGSASYGPKDFREASTILARNVESMPGVRMTPDASLKTFKTPEDLVVETVLREPDVAQPTHFSWDHRGRLWVAHYRQYPYPSGARMLSRDKYYRGVYDRMPAPPPNHEPGKGAVSVHEDANGDGRYESSRIVLGGLNMANAVVHGHGGIWVMHTPHLLFYPDANGDDVPDRDPEVRLSGFGLEDTHSTANGLVWGPDGWLYGAQGSTTTCRVRRPGLDSDTAPGVHHEGCMVWRYHPILRRFEIFAEGGGNNFGLELDGEGRLFTGHNGGQTRGWHFIPGGRYLRQGRDPGKFGVSPRPFDFGDLSFMPSSNAIPRFSHQFAVVDGEALPARLRGTFLSVDPLHRQVIISRRVAEGSTFRTMDDGVALECSDPSSRAVFIANAPDGSVLVADFYEEFIAHGQNYQGQIDPDSGRIHRLSGRDLRLRRVPDFGAMSSTGLVEHLGDSQKSWRQTAVRMLAERRDPAVRSKLVQMLGGSGPHPALEALWVLYQCGWLESDEFRLALGHPAPAVRAWCVRLAGESAALSAATEDALLEGISVESDPEVRSMLASTALRTGSRRLALRLLEQSWDVRDPFIPLMVWWSVEPHTGVDREAILSLIANGRVWNSEMAVREILPRLVKRWMMGNEVDSLTFVARLLGEAGKQGKSAPLLAAFDEAVSQRSFGFVPRELTDVLKVLSHPSPVLRWKAGDASAFEEVMAMAANAQLPALRRLMAIRALGSAKRPGLGLRLLALARDPALSPDIRRAALSASAGDDSRELGEALIRERNGFPEALRVSVDEVLLSRPGWTSQMLDALESGILKGHDIRKEIWIRMTTQTSGETRERALKWMDGKNPSTSPASESGKELARLKSVILAGPGNPYAGEATFMTRCAGCHRLFHKGGSVGPDLTAYQRDDLGTLLPSLLNPDVEIREGYAAYSLKTRDDRTWLGILHSRTEREVVIRGLDGTESAIPVQDVLELVPLGRSLMPEGLLEGLSDGALRDFFAYLRIPQPISR